MAIILLFVVGLNILLGVFVFLNNPRSASNRFFSIMSYSAAMWTLANYMISISPSFFWVASSYALGSLVISSGLVWTFLITETTLHFWGKIVIVFLAFFFLAISFKPGFIPPNFQLLYSPEFISQHLDWSLILYALFYFLMGTMIIYKLNRAYAASKSRDPQKGNQFMYILVGASITLTTTAVNSFVLPFLSIYISKGIDSIGFLLFLFLVAFAITRHHLFNIKVFAIEIITLTLLIFLMVRTFLSKNTYETFVNSTIFLSVLVLASILIQSILQGIRQRREIEELSARLNGLYGDISPKDTHN